MEELITYRTDLLSALEGGVNDLSKIAAQLPSAAWHQPVHPDAHTPHYILFHLRELDARVFAAQLPRILVEDTPLLPVFDDQSWMDSHYDIEEPVLAIMEELSKLRKPELGWLRNLTPTEWSRLARHPWWGEHTLQWWVELQVDYSSQHLIEISSVLDR